MRDDERPGITRLSHPILRLDVVGPHGTRQSEYRVFCKYQQRSVPIGTCCACAHCDAIVSSPAPSVECSVPLEGPEPLPDPHGVRTAVGGVLARGAVVIDPSVTVREALGILRAEDRRSVAVVDDRRAIIGVVHEATFVRRPGERREPPDESIMRIMSGSIVIDESLSVRKALELLAASHLREATVVNEEGVPLGLFRDVDGLRWLVGARDRDSAGPSPNGAVGDTRTSPNGAVGRQHEEERPRERG
jgi:CBS domain-containing protein